MKNVNDNKAEMKANRVDVESGNDREKGSSKTDAPVKPDEAIGKLRGLIKDIRIAMLTTVDSEGHIRSRPMGTKQTETGTDLWFMTEADSAKCAELDRNPDVQVTYADNEHHRYVSVSGKARVVKDPAKAKELWTTFDRAWFPKGAEDPNIALVKVTVERAEYWDSPSSPVVYLIGFAKAIVTGKRYEGEAADHQKLRISV